MINNTSTPSSVSVKSEWGVMGKKKKSETELVNNCGIILFDQSYISNRRASWATALYGEKWKEQDASLIVKVNTLTSLTALKFVN